MTFLADLGERLADAVDRFDIPGAAVAVSQGGELAEAAAGVLNRNTGVSATADSTFQIGSVTKVWTAALVMQLVDDGLVALDAPVRRYLPDFAVADEQVGEAVTVRQLLSHTGGFAGDLFEDTGPGDDALDRYLAYLAKAATTVHEPGAMFSYSNSGYCVLGAIVARLRGGTWESVVRERLIGPLGAERMALSAGEAILFRTAVGHTKAPGAGELTVFPRWVMPRSNAPAGATMCAAPRDLIRFGRLFLAGGANGDGARLLSPDAVAAMRSPQVDVPGTRSRFATRWGLGFMLFDWGTPVIGHDGATIGQMATWRVLPEHDVVVAACINGGLMSGLFDHVLEPVIADLTGVRIPPRPTPPSPPPAVDLTPYVGRYASAVGLFEVVAEDGGLRITEHPDEQITALGGITESERYLPYDGDTFIGAEQHDGAHVMVTFVGGGRYLHNSRAIPRAAD
jgi:CubicO group peptidase (beta-lactamase class C family)